MLVFDARRRSTFFWVGGAEQETQRMVASSVKDGTAGRSRAVQVHLSSYHPVAFVKFDDGPEWKADS
jgi:hypothetical protein